jgi:hypothetical protein
MTMQITDEMVEAAAERIFGHWIFQPKDRLPIKWVPDGNSEKQAEARLYAIAALEAAMPLVSSGGMSEVRYHQKRDGVLRIAADGACRYLTAWERIRWLFGARP